MQEKNIGGDFVFFCRFIGSQVEGAAVSADTQTSPAPVTSGGAPRRFQASQETQSLQHIQGLLLPVGEVPRTPLRGGVPNRCLSHPSRPLSMWGSSGTTPSSSQVTRQVRALQHHHNAGVGWKHTVESINGFSWTCTVLQLIRISPVLLSTCCEPTVNGQLKNILSPLYQLYSTSSANVSYHMHKFFLQLLNILRINMPQITQLVLSERVLEFRFKAITDSSCNSLITAEKYTFISVN